MTNTKQDDTLFSEKDTSSRIVEDLWFAARRGQGDVRYYEKRIERLICDTVNNALDEVKSKKQVMTFDVNSDKPESMTFVPLSAIEQVRKEWSHGE